MLDDSIDFLWKFADPESGCSIVFDDDGRVAYAYFLNREQKITGDVWLYNRCKTPAEPEWTECERAPFANPAEYAINHDDFTPVGAAADVKVEWQHSARGQLVALVFIREQLAAMLADGTLPGWSTMASKDGPLANTMNGRLQEHSSLSERRITPARRFPRP